MTVTVNNGAANFTETFNVTVMPAPIGQPPTLNAITNQVIYNNAVGPQTVNLSGISACRRVEIQR